MSEKSELPIITARDAAWSQQQQEAANNQASYDLAGWTALARSEAFDKVFMRRIREKRADIEHRILEGEISVTNYQMLVVERKVLLEIEALPESDKMSAWKLLHPEMPQIPKSPLD